MEAFTSVAGVWTSAAHPARLAAWAALSGPGGGFVRPELTTSTRARRAPEAGGSSRSRAGPGLAATHSGPTGPTGRSGPFGAARLGAPPSRKPGAWPAA
jgi:hypothetical protein